MLVAEVEFLRGGASVKTRMYSDCAEWTGVVVIALKYMCQPGNQLNFEWIVDFVQVDS